MTTDIDQTASNTYRQGQMMTLTVSNSAPATPQRFQAGMVSSGTV